MKRQPVYVTCHVEKNDSMYVHDRVCNMAALDSENILSLFVRSSIPVTGQPTATY